jgi:hypothetical protein
MGSSLSLFGFEHTVHYSIHKEVITISSLETGYTSSVFCRGKFTSLIGRETPIVYSELEALGGIHGRYQNARGKFKDLPEENIHNSAVLGSAFYNGLNQYVLSWPSKGDPELNFLYTYQMKCKELMTLSTLVLNDLDRTDSFEYYIRVPTGISLYYHVKELPSFLHIDSTQTAAGTMYHFLACPPAPIVLADHLQDYEYNEFPARFIQLILVPEPYKSRPWNWLNDWFRNILKDHLPLDSQTEKAISSVCSTATEPDSIAKSIFDFVKSKISYVDVENGLGAFRPRDANTVLKNRQGDCKDMSNLLCEALRYKGLDAYLAISSTLAYEVDLVFPSLSSGNHMICVLKTASGWKFLDATDPVCIYGYPSLHTQARHIYILNNTGGEWLEVPKIDASQNLSTVTFNLKDSLNFLTGTFSNIYKGLSRHDLIQSFTSSQQEDDRIILKRSFERNSLNTTFTDLNMLSNKSYITIGGTMTVANKLPSSESMNSLLLNFLPYPHKYPHQCGQGKKIILYQTQDNRLECRIEFAKVIHLKRMEPVHFEKDGFLFDFSAEQYGDHAVVLKYRYYYNEVSVPYSDRKTYNELNELIDQIFATPLRF